MIIYVDNLDTSRQSLTIPFAPSEDVSGQLCELRIENQYVSTSSDVEVYCNLTQPHSAEYKYSSTQTSLNECIYIKVFTNGGLINETLNPTPRYVYVPPGPQDLTFSIIRSNNGFDDLSQSNLKFAFLISLVPAPFLISNIPASLFIKSYSFPFQIIYDPPVHLAGKEVTLQLDASSTFTPWRQQKTTIKELTQIHTNDNRVIAIRATNNPRFNNPIKFYMPYGPFIMTIDQDEPLTSPSTPTSSNLWTANSWTWEFTASSNTQYAFRAFDATNTKLRLPRSNMTTNTQTIDNVSFTASSSPGDGDQFTLFDGDNLTEWYPVAGQYDATSGIYTGASYTTVSGVSIGGVWVQLQSGSPFLMQDYTHYVAYNQVVRWPVSWKLAGSDDGITWTLLSSRDNVTTSSYSLSGSGSTTQRFYPTTITGNNTYFKYYRFIVTKVGSGSGTTAITQLNLNGIFPETWESSSSYDATTGAYTGTTDTQGVLGEYIQMEPPWTGFNATGLTFESYNTVGSYKVFRSIDGPQPFIEVTFPDILPLSYGSGLNNDVRYRIVFTSSTPGNTSVKVSGALFTGTYNAMPRMMFTFKEV